MEKISVIVPIYNVEKYLERCIQSIIKQTYKNLEIILVNDGSTDNCARICEEYAQRDSRIKVIHKKNGGLADARNKGLEIATGEYIGFIDSDDYIEEDMYEYLYSLLQENNADISICGKYLVYEDGEIKSKYNVNDGIKVFNTEEALIQLNSFSSFNMSVWDRLYKAEIVKDIKFPFGKKSEDYFVMYQYFSKAQKVVVSELPKYYYFQRANSISRGKAITHDYIEGAKRQKEFFDKNYPKISFVGNTAYAFSYIATYNRYIKNEVKLSKENKKIFKKEVKKNRKDIIKNKYISKNKKLQAILFTISLKLYKKIYRVMEQK